MKTLHIKPAVEGSIVRKEDMTVLDKDGEVVRESAYWHRRLRDEDVTLVPEKKQTKKEIEK